MKSAVHKYHLRSEQWPELSAGPDRAPHPSQDKLNGETRTALAPEISIAGPRPITRDGASGETMPSALVPTVFHEDWWLDAATGGHHSVVEVSNGGKTVGRLPFMMLRRMGLEGIWTPPLTHFLGPAIVDGNGSQVSRYLHRLEITRELLSKLPRQSWQCLRCHRGTTDGIAFQEESFKIYAQFTYEIAAASAETLWRQMRDKTRNVIRRAQEQLSIGGLDDADEFANLYVQHLTAKKIRNTLDLSAARRIISAALARDRGRIVVARNAENKIVAANFCAWDDTSEYYIACTRSDGAGNGAASLLLWEAIQHAAERGRIFDFAGLGTRGSVLHYAGFGGTVGTRFVAIRATGLGRLMSRARLLLMDEHFLF